MLESAYFTVLYVVLFTFLCGKLVLGKLREFGRIL